MTGLFYLNDIVAVPRSDLQRRKSFCLFYFGRKRILPSASSVLRCKTGEECDTSRGTDKHWEGDRKKRRTDMARRPPRMKGQTGGFTIEGRIWDHSPEWPFEKRPMTI